MKNKEISLESKELNFLKKVNVHPIGNVKILQSCFYLHINNKFKQALKHLNSFSHILVFMKCYRQNSDIELSYNIAKIIDIDERRGIIQIDNIKVENNTIIYDLKPYFPCEDRLEICSVPDSHVNDSYWRKEFISNEVSLDSNIDSNCENNELQQYNLDTVGQYKRVLGKEVLVLPKVSIDYFDEIEGYSHVRVLWWFDRFDKKTYRKTLLSKPPYENAPETGIFATRSPVRPNLIASTIVKIAEIDKKNKCIEIQGFDGLEKSPVLGIVPYVPSEERVKEFYVPKWLSHWPKWKSFNKETIIDNQINLEESDIDRINRLIYSQRNSELEDKAINPNKNLDNAGIQKLNCTNVKNEITIYNAHQNNLKNISTSIPKNKITVITGVSGSGKSSLAFDTIYAESQSQFIDLMSSTGGLAGDSMERPDVAKITGLQPAIAIEQKSLGKNPRSTVGTATGIVDYLKLLFATIGTRYCPECHHAVQSVKKEDILEILLKIDYYNKLTIVPYKKVEKTKTFDKPMSEYKSYKTKLAEYIDEALLIGNGAISVIIDDHEPFLFQTSQMCFNCNRILFDIIPSYFSYNNPEYMCPICKGLGEELKFDESSIVNNPNISLLDDASKWWGNLRKFIKNMNANWMKGEVIALANEMNVDLELPYKDLPELFKKQIMYGSKGRKVKLIYDNKNGRKGEIERPVEGVYNIITRLFRENTGDTATKLATEFMSKTVCNKCNGEKLDDEGRLVSIQGVRYPEAVRMTLLKLKEWLAELLVSLPSEKLELSKIIIYELNKQLDKLIHVGLSYLTLDRTIPTLSGGEAQRLRIASQFNTNLTNILYVMDEPSMGLHPRDYKFLIKTIQELKEAGNTIIMVEHEEDMILEADKIIDIGPLAGKYGGSIIAEGTLDEIIHNKSSITGKYLRRYKNTNNKLLVLSETSKESSDKKVFRNCIKIFGARLNNLKNVNVSIPIGVFTCVTGVSGSGKSSLISQTLYPALESLNSNKNDLSPVFDKIEGAENIKRVINVSQHPIGKTPRSNPATYTGLFDLIRNLYSKTQEARQRGLKKEHFSFNSKKGQCQVCNGNGRICTPMHFMPDIWIKCTHCNGKRYKSEVLEIKHNDKSIADILDMDVDEALVFFKDERKIYNIIKMISDVGLGYIKLGQSALTLSGGEAQRIKLAKELSQATTNNVVYILDEPTTGLHFEDIHRLLDIIYRLTSRGNTVIAIEHNLDFIIGADYIIDMGPEGGINGGYIIAVGTPNEVTENPESITGKFIKSKINSLS